MNSKSNTNFNLKRLSIAGAITAVMILSPAIAMADKGDRGHNREHNTVVAGQKHHKGNFRVKEPARKVHGGSHKIRHTNWRKRHDGHRHKYYKHPHNRHAHHGYHDNGHRHVNYVVHDHYYYDDGYDLDYLRFMIGLHSDNLDIILHD
jgi:hypothetical protein